jgi:lipopolysaccharide assembly outer membrane protein LptD (OstA)
MLRSYRKALFGAVALTLLTSRVAEAQIPGIETSVSGTTERVSEFHWKLTDKVEINNKDMQLLAETVEYFSDSKQLKASGNVVFSQANQRVSADNIDFNVDTKTGTFYNAYGTMALQVDRKPGMFGTQEPDVMFYGETAEKIGPTRYKVTKGAFTTCVQPSPRWQLTSGTVILSLDEYAFLTNSLLKVKGVPVFYFPIFYYPINDEDRATGFLIPQYGASTFRGQTLSNAFFWAINRSHDATVMHDWFSKTGQGMGAEYRYVLAPGSEGILRTYLLDEHEFQNADGSVQPARRSYEVRGSANQGLGRHLRARGRVDYFSDITVQQTYNTNIYEASRRSRTIATALTGTWGIYNATGAYERSETFFGTDSSTLNGATPRVTLSRGERPIGRSPVYFSFNSDYSHLLRENRNATTLQDNGLDRLDLLPLVRFPFTRWPFLTINTSVMYRNTFWTESLGELDGLQAQIPEAISRHYVDFQSQLVGPVFTRIFDTPKSRYAQRFKHTIEPFLNFQRLSPIDQFNSIVKLDAVDTVVGKMTQYRYGINNRLYARRQEGTAPTPTAREIASLSITQTYYTDEKAAQFDQYYRTSFTGPAPSHFSPVSIQARVAPTLDTLGSFRAEYDTQFTAFRSLGADATIVVRDRLQSTIGWSQRRFIEGLPGFDNPEQLDHYLNQATLLRTRDNRFGTHYSFNYDMRLNSFLQQRIMAYYNAQCCGFSVEYQMFDLSRLGVRAPVTEDRRLNFSFTLAGIGSFSNFFGALGGAP